jgi:hypothetical protein
MADAEGTPGGLRNTVTDEELRGSFAGPAFNSNKFYATNLETGVRLAFAEQLGSKVPTQFRTAVILSYRDAIGLRDLLARQLATIEPQIRAAKGEAKGEGKAEAKSEAEAVKRAADEQNG